MSYAASKQFVSPGGLSAPGSDGPALSWELDSATTAARQDTWLLSFIDILALLLTLLVLLLAFQERDHRLAEAPVEGGQQTARVAPFSLQALLQPDSSALLVPAQFDTAPGYALPGDGLLPQPLAEVAAGPAAAPAPEVPLESVESQSSEPRDVAAPEISEQAVPAGLESGQDAPQREPVAVQSPQAAPESSEHGPAAGFASPLSVAQSGSAPVPVQTQIAVEPLDRVIAALDSSPLRDRIEVVAGSGDVSLEISDSILFPPASAALSPTGSQLLDELAVLLQVLPYTLSVEGHTDNVPIQTARYPSNWELSSARAAAVTRALIEKRVAPERMRAIGYGATRPRDDNGSEAGRARNRRVTFVLQLEGEV